MMPSQHPSAPSEMAHSPMHYPQHLQTLKVSDKNDITSLGQQYLQLCET